MSGRRDTGCAIGAVDLTGDMPIILGPTGSGYGRELDAHGIRAFCNVKTVWVGE